MGDLETARIHQSREKGLVEGKKKGADTQTAQDGKSREWLAKQTGGKKKNWKTHLYALLGRRTGKRGKRRNIVYLS